MLLFPATFYITGIKIRRNKHAEIIITTVVPSAGKTKKCPSLLHVFGKSIFY